jgi:hypothetical protein
MVLRVTVIVDVFMFDDEFDTLDCRLYQMRGLVDLFVAIEANQSVSGMDKPYHLTENINRYPDIPMEVIRVDLARADLERDGGWHSVRDWRRDAVQRNGATEFLRDLPSDTVVITGDLDEIVRRDTIESFNGEPLTFEMSHLVYSLKIQHQSGWLGGVMAQRGAFGARTLNEIRHTPYRSTIRKVPHAGWHLSFFGTPEDRVRKLRHFAHQELVHLGDRVGEEMPRAYLHVDGTTLIPYEGDWPDWAAAGLAPAHWYADWREES